MTLRGPVRERAVFAAAEALVRRQCEDEAQRALLQAALAKIGGHLQRPPPPPFYLSCVHVPLLVYAALRGEQESALPLAVACLFVHAGLDLLDDVMDGDLPDAWRSRPAQAVLAGATLTGALAPLALLALPAPPRTVLALQRLLAEAGLALSAGQQGDLAAARTAQIPPGVAVAHLAERKTGAELALYAALAARLGGAKRGVGDRWTAFGRALGAARQLRTDCFDLFAAEQSRDLSAGTRTLPIALCHDALAEAERPAFLDLLRRAQRDAAAQRTIREKLVATGILQSSALVVESYCQRARDALAATGAREPAASELQAMIDDCSFFAAGSIARTEGAGGPAAGAEKTAGVQP
ncbi:MAG TPA: polyprenyl synthetase family protein [Dehalococcoidia bacterium]|nr:polyprenyl synthetase family protein [Dehalococcoidia bacterium]